MVPLTLSLTDSGDTLSVTHTDWIWRQSLRCLHWLSQETVPLILSLTKSGDGPSDTFTGCVWRWALWYLHWLSLETAPSKLTLTKSGDSPFDTYINWVWRQSLWYLHWLSLETAPWSDSSSTLGMTWGVVGASLGPRASLMMWATWGDMVWRACCTRRSLVRAAAADWGLVKRM